MNWRKPVLKVLVILIKNSLLFNFCFLKVLNFLENRQVNNYGLSYSQTYGGFMGGMSPVNNYGAGYFQTYVGKRSIGKIS